MNRESRKPLALGAALGNCVHVAGLLRFLRLAEQEGYRTVSLGAAVPVDRLVAEIARQQPDLVAVSYRLTPEVGRRLLEDLATQVRAHGLVNRRFVFGGTEPVAREARQVGLFDQVFGGESTPEQVLACLRGQRAQHRPVNRASTLVQRLENNDGYPLLRHHFGQSTVEATVAGAREIAEAGVLDVLSLGPDQNAQQFFFRPEQMRPELDGAGGVPLRRPEDLEAVYQATRCGNYPLVRIYAGTQDMLKWAELAVRTLHNAWGAVPLFWYNRLDGRSARPLVASIAENQQVMRWYAERNLPLECNEAHHWSLRGAPDAVAVAAAFLGAYNAKAAGVRLYVAQYMFNTPAGTWPSMDLAKMLAKRTLIQRLHDAQFISVTQARAGLACFRPDPDQAKGQLAASTVFQMALQPQIIHVVGYSEGDHAITAPELIESCRIVHGVLAQCREGVPEMTADAQVARRCEELVADAEVILEAIRQLGEGEDDPWTHPETLAEAVCRGVLDAPDLAGNPAACGQIRTAMVAGTVRSTDRETGRPLTEQQRLESLGIRL